MALGAPPPKPPIMHQKQMIQDIKKTQNSAASLDKLMKSLSTTRVTQSKFRNNQLPRKIVTDPFSNPRLPGMWGANGP